MNFIKRIIKAISFKITLFSVYRIFAREFHKEKPIFVDIVICMTNTFMINSVFYNKFINGLNSIKDGLLTELKHQSNYIKRFPKFYKRSYKKYIYDYFHAFNDTYISDLDYEICRIISTDFDEKIYNGENVSLFDGVCSNYFMVKAQLLVLLQIKELINCVSWYIQTEKRLSRDTTIKVMEKIFKDEPCLPISLKENDKKTHFDTSIKPIIDMELSTMDL